MAATYSVLDSRDKVQLQSQMVSDKQELQSNIDTNKTDIKSLKSNKVNVSDIVNDLTTGGTDKPLSAQMGVDLKGKIDSHNISSTAHSDIRTELDKTHDASNITKGTLPIARGGTNASDVATARKNIMFGIVADDVDVTGDTKFLTTTSANDGTVKNTPASKIFGYVSEGTWSLGTGEEIGGYENLDDYKTMGNFICKLDSYAINVVNSPTGGKAFMLKVGDLLGDGEYPFQEIIRYTDGASWFRTYNRASSLWNAWHSTSFATARKSLWTGTWNAGSVEVPGLHDYTTYIFYANSGALMTGFMSYDKTRINCYGIICPEKNVMKLESATFDVSGNTLTQTMPRSWTITGTAITAADGALVITRIEGLF